MSDHSANAPLAIVGMACRLPGADNLDQFWQLLRTGGSGIVELPADRLDRELYYHPAKGRRNKSYSALGGLVSPRPFDGSACPLPNELIERSDVAHLTLCEVAAAACRHAKLDPFDLPLRNTGVFVGHTAASPLASQVAYAAGVAEMAQYLSEVEAIRSLPSGERDDIIREIVEAVRRDYARIDRGNPVDLSSHAAAGLISRGFGLTGPFLVVDAACASSLQALFIGAAALRQGRVDMAIVGGASYCKADTLVLFSQAQSLSARGSRPFDADADGLILAEGYVVLVVKTLARALADGDDIQAVIRGIGMATDGRGKSLWAPRKEGQILAIHRAYEPDLDASTLDYIEAHATSTQVGDATELQALAEALHGRLPHGKKIPIGSVKANVGHTLEAAGLSGLAKTVLAMRNAVIPPAINCQRLNPEINWQQAPFFIPTSELAWPAGDRGRPRRAGVNSFGIGGLNVHVVLDEFPEPTASRSVSTVVPCEASPRMLEPEAIAIVGAGCILPGARTLDAFWELLASGRDSKSPLPLGRWNPASGFNPKTGRSFVDEPARGGFITDYAYDWKRHVVPPKQVEQANPLQFMLLDATEDALRDAGYDHKPLDRSRVGVVVGTIFGDEFAQQLNMGLRLPQFNRTLAEVLGRRGMQPQATEDIAHRFADVLIKHMPALVDETGSFTSSTLASRITKAFDLQGGALALDAGSASGLAVVATGVDFLLCGACDLVVCAAGDRNMGLLNFEAYASEGKLATGPLRSPFDAQAAGSVPGEGAGVILLKRLSDARRDGDRIRGIIRGSGAGSGEGIHDSTRLAMRRALRSARLNPEQVVALETTSTAVPDQDSKHVAAIAETYGLAGRSAPLELGSLTGQIGNACAAAGMAGLIKTTLALDHTSFPPNVALDELAPWLADKSGALRASSRASRLSAAGGDERLFAGVTACVDGRLAYHVLVERGTAVAASSPPARPIGVAVPGVIEQHWPIVRIGAATLAELTSKVRAAESAVDSLFASARASAFTKDDVWRLALVVDSSAALVSKLRLAGDQIANPASRGALEEQGIICREVTAQPARVAMVFPGQGSQYSGMLAELVRVYPAAAAAQQEVDAAMALFGLPNFAEISADALGQLGVDVFRTQIAMLLADVILFRTLTSLGVRPEVVSGHSFGEFPALVAAGAWSLEQAVGATSARCRAIETSWNGPPSEMLSTTAPPDVVRGSLQSLPNIFVSHHNAPDQTVVAGETDSVQQLAARLQSQGFDTRPLAVPRPFHTPLMAGAQEPFHRALASAWIVPPRIPITSSVTNRRAESADEIRANLASQLTAPVNYVGLIEQLAREANTVFVEVGPQQVLTRLNRRILGASAVSIASDNPKRNPLEQLSRVIAQLDCAGALVERQQSAMQSSPTTKAPRGPLASEFVNFDATQRRKDKARTRAAGPRVSAGEPPTQDASPALSTQAPTLATPQAPVVSAAPPATRASTVDGRMSPALPSSVVAATGRAGRGPVAIRPRANAPRREELEKFLINFVVEQTGYPTEIVRLDADLEADLGIDSIKKAQLFGELAEFYDVSAPENLRLDDFPTLRHVLELLQASSVDAGLTEPAMAIAQAVSAPPGGAPLFAGPSPLTAATIASPNGAPSMAPGRSRGPVTIRPRANAPRREELEKFLVNFVVEQTGYPTEIVRLDADLEADLGIDSIKKAQLIGELAEFYDVSAPENLRLEDFPTLRHVLELLQTSSVDGGQSALTESSRLGQPNPGPTPPVMPAFGRSEPIPSPTTYSGNGMALAPPDQGFASGSAGSVAVRNRGPVIIRPRANAPRREELEKFLVNFVVEQTGYPTEIVRLDADLEADLGIDSIKKAQLFGELAEFYDVSAPENLRLEDFPTLRHVLELLQASSITTAAGPASIGGSLGETALRGQSAWVSSAPVVSALAAALGISQFAAPAGTAYDVGRQFGQQHATRICAMLKRFAELAPACAADTARLEAMLRDPGALFSAGQLEQLQGVADGARVHVGNVIAAYQQTNGAAGVGSAESQTAPAQGTAATTDAQPQKPRVTQRLVLRMMNAPWSAEHVASGFVPKGAVLILGDNPIARALEKRLASPQVNVLVVASSGTWESVREQFNQLWARQPIAHVFLATPHDAEARTTDNQPAWDSRRERGLILPFLLCQEWVGRLTDAGMAEGTTVVAITALGGDFGLATNIGSVEGGGLVGLVKGMYIESLYEPWKGLRCQALDFTADESPESAAAMICRELSTDEPNLEVGFAGGKRRVLRAVPCDIGTEYTVDLPRGTWVVTGGGRGVTAVAAVALARRWELNLHLVGTAPVPQIDPSWRTLSADGLAQLKISIMRQAASQGLAPHEAWTKVDKALQIDRTLRACAAADVRATYHSCDVSDSQQLDRVLSEIRAADGPIEGVLHGAAVIRDSAMERKKLANVRLTIAAKADAVAALVELTRNDPLRHFIAFSSASGRFGFRGQVDYAAANELLSKQLDAFRRQRPECHSVAVHWHAWDEIGLAARPELQSTFATLEVKFMPPAEGVDHLVREIEAGLAEPEVLFTDAAYLKKEYPVSVIATADEIAAAESKTEGVAQSTAESGQAAAAELPMIARVSEHRRGQHVSANVQFEPTRDPFLVEHRMGGKPLLPLVMAIECLAQAAQCAAAGHVVSLERIEIHNGLPFKDEQPQTVQVVATSQGGGRYRCQLTSEFRDREGRLVDPARMHVTGEVTLDAQAPKLAVEFSGGPPLGWFPIAYPEDAPIYHGQKFRTLKQVACQYDGAFGQIVAPAIEELGGSRTGGNWIIPAAVLDGCLFACGTFAYSMFGKRVEIPAGIDRLRLARTPRTGEGCQMRMYFRGHEARGARYDFDLFGEDGACLMSVEGYRTTAIVPGTVDGGRNQ